ncbi:hypothetical protein [Mycoplasmopsis columboralis]|uniref:Lipoprotein n=1 Tax=Mycoplasmopsis columboralis TaxID=171282 RepID=A0A449B658_9BACT|nr:hypothetical protein [Mycoplasmopsis columboralis]VEU76059.1 Uncharacterised protein [Mycoplasmopsis columboralis]
MKIKFVLLPLIAPLFIVGCQKIEFNQNVRVIKKENISQEPKQEEKHSLFLSEKISYLHKFFRPDELFLKLEYNKNEQFNYIYFIVEFNSNLSDNDINTYNDEYKKEFQDTKFEFKSFFAKEFLIFEFHKLNVPQTNLITQKLINKKEIKFIYIQPETTKRDQDYLEDRWGAFNDEEFFSKNNKIKFLDAQTKARISGYNPYDDFVNKSMLFEKDISYKVVFNKVLTEEEKSDFENWLSIVYGDWILEDFSKEDNKITKKLKFKSYTLSKGLIVPLLKNKLIKEIQVQLQYTPYEIDENYEFIPQYRPAVVIPEEPEIRYIAYANEENLWKNYFSKKSKLYKNDLIHYVDEQTINFIQNKPKYVINIFNREYFLTTYYIFTLKEPTIETENKITEQLEKLLNKKIKLHYETNNTLYFDYKQNDTEKHNQILKYLSSSQQIGHVFVKVVTTTTVLSV